MRAAQSPVLVVLLAAPLLLDCSLMNLDDFSERRCKSDADCLPALAAFGDPKRCESYACRQGSCVPQPGVESCNGADDDCNGLIDDGLAVKPHEQAGTSSPSAVLAHAVAPSGRVAYVVGGADPEHGVQGVLVVDTSAEQAVPLSFASAAMDHSDKDRACPALTNSAGVAASGCRIDDVALAADRDHLIYAAINTLGCAAGQLRVGLAAASEPFRIWLGSTPAGQSPRSNIEVGVDVQDGACSGAAARAGHEEGSGARSPAVAVLDASPGGAGGLVTWLGTEYSAKPLPSCGSAVDVPVQALGVRVPEDARDADQAWLVGSDEGVPISIGQTSSRRPPAVVGLAAEGSIGRYLVAFPARNEDDATGVALVSVTAGPQHLDFAPLLFIPDDQPDGVSLARDTSGGGLALAWRSGCGAESLVKLALLTAAGALRTSSPLALAAPNITSKPQLLHASDGFTTQKQGGGWYVAWSEQPKPGGGRTQLARVAESSAMVLEISTITSGAVGLPLLFPGDGTMMNQGLVTATGTEAPEIPVFPSWCQ